MYANKYQYYYPGELNIQDDRNPLVHSDGDIYLWTIIDYSGGSI